MLQKRRRSALRNRDFVVIRKRFRLRKLYVADVDDDRLLNAVVSAQRIRNLLGIA